MNLITKFNLRSKVKLPIAVHKDITGVVIAIWICDDGLQYKVRYFWESKPQEVYFYESELEEVV